MSQKSARSILNFAVLMGISEACLASTPMQVYFYQGRQKVQVEVETGKFSVDSDKWSTSPATIGAEIKTSLPTAAIEATRVPRKLIVEPAKSGLAELNLAATRLKTLHPTIRPEAILHAPSPVTNDDYLYLSDKISFKLPVGTTLDSVIAKWGLADVRPVSFSPNTYTASVSAGATDLMAGLNTANNMQETGAVRWASPLLARQAKLRLVPNDPLFPNQWHLRNLGSNTSQGVAGNDLNVVPAWDISTGLGVNIAISDDGLETTHTDLTGNVRTDLDYDFNADDNDPTPEPSFYTGFTTTDSHGTACAGVAAAKGNNGIGVSGSAPNASLLGLRLVARPTTDLQEASAMDWKTTEALPVNQVFINSNSWGPSDNGATLEGPGPLTEAALAAGVQSGRNGKGVVYVWAAGNGRTANDNINKDGYASNPNVIAIGATNSAGTFSYYSEPGAAMLVNAPSNHSADAIWTTDLSGLPGYTANDYTSSFGGTSSAAPATAGVVGLILAANPTLTYRDVMHILVRTATQNAPAESGWLTNGAGRKFSHNYGFGRVNAAAAVSSALAWQNVPSTAPDKEVEYIPPAPIAIPDNNTTGVSVILPISSSPNFSVEHVELEANITHTYRGDLRILLQSPSGTVSQMIATSNDSNDNYLNWRFRSVAHWDENPTGNWTVTVSDGFSVDTGDLNYLKLRIMGYIKPASAVDAWALY